MWQNDSTGQATVWYQGGANGTTFLGFNQLTPGVTGWRIVGTADFNRDGHPDLVWQNEATRQATVWYMGGPQGNTFLSFSFLTASGVPGWRIVAIDNINADQYPDLVWQNDATRESTVWYMGGANGDTMQAWVYLSGAVPGWRIVATGDFNRDGRTDVVWQNDGTRQATVWYLGGANGTVLQNWGFVAANEVPGWTIVGAADFNRDGYPDLVWQNDSTRQATVWYLGGAIGALLPTFAYIVPNGVPGWHLMVAK